MGNVNLSFGWESPRLYVLRHWLFGWCWYRSVGIVQLRLLGFHLTLSRRVPRMTQASTGKGNG